MTQREAERIGLVKRPNKYGARPVAKCPCCGHRHDSQVEAAFCADLHKSIDTGHIDIGPVVTLASGTRWKLDFAVWSGRRVDFYDVKGKETREFKERRKEFDRLHPGAPLIVVHGKKTRRGWDWVYE